MANTNLGNWFGLSPRERELRETRESWAEAERLWQASPLAQTEITDLVLELMREAMREFGREPAYPILLELCVATDRLLRLEDIIAIEAEWPLIESDLEVALNVRKMLTRRKRWAANFDQMFGIVRRQLLAGFGDLFRLFPEVCFEEWDADHEGFGVPLIELLRDPAAFIQELLLFAYDDATLRYDLFLRYREQLATNLLVASGFRPDANIREVEHRLIMPAAQKNKSAAELARLYLAHTPFETVLELPVPFEVPDHSRFEHCHIVGGTGHGKTQLLQRMIHDDLLKAQKERRSILVIDSQGDLIAKLRRLALFDPEAPNSLADRLVVIDPADMEFPAALNLFDAKLDRLADYRPVDQERVLNGVIELYETFFGDLLGAELTQKQGVIFKYLARLMLTIPDATIHTLMQLMDNGRPFKPYMDKLNGSARYFFEREFFDPSFAATKKQVLKRLWGVLATPAFERMFAQPTNKLDLFEALQDGKIVLVSTAKDLLKRDGSQLFGRFVLAMVAQATAERATVPEDERTPTFVYVDEAQEYFGGDDIETMLNQGRKYGVGLTLAHQALDQLSPRLRAVLASNTTMKCAGGVSAKDARALAEELHTTPDFIESMTRRGDRTEFAAWVKHRTANAVRLSVPLGFLERQPTLSDEAYDQLEVRNRARYCGTLADASFAASIAPDAAVEDAPPVGAREQPSSVPPRRLADPEPLQPERRADGPVERPPPPPRPVADRELGKGGPKHRYLQSLVKELAEAQGFRATIEAPLPDGTGQVDVLLQRADISVAVEVSVTTPVEVERLNVRKCLAAGYERVALVLVKSARTQARYRDLIAEGLSDTERTRLTFLLPEAVPDFIAGLSAPADSETVVKGYRVKLSRTAISPDQARERRETIARVVAQSIREQKG